MEDEDLESGLDAVNNMEETEEAAPEEEEQGELSPLEIARLYRRADVRKTQAANELKKQLDAARNVLLQQPTQMTRSDKLLGIASTLLAPGPVGRAGTIGESLGALGKYFGDVSAAEREAKQAQAEALSKFDIQRIQQEVSAATEEQKALSTLLGKYGQKRAPTSEFERLIANLPPEKQEELRNRRAQVLSSRAPKAEKTEIDPERPSSVVIGRVASVVNRDLKPVADRLGALNETRAAIADARTNPAQAPQVDRFFARLSGDSQLSQLEVNAVANAGSFPSRISNQLSKFFTGTPTDLSLDDKAKVLEVLEKILAPSYNSKRNQILNQFSVASDISPEATEKIVGPRYLTAEERKVLREKTPVAPPAGAIEMLRKNPNLAPEFDKKYGDGAAKKYLGG